MTGAFYCRQAADETKGLGGVIFSKWSSLMAPEGEGGNGGGGGDGAPAPSLRGAGADCRCCRSGCRRPEDQDSELLGKLKAAAARTLLVWKGDDPDAVRNILSKFANDEELGLICCGRIDEVLDKRTTRMKAGFKQKPQRQRTAREAAEASADKFSAPRP
ncbi:hypothetical protein [Pseudomonas gorinensis]